MRVTWAVTGALVVTVVSGAAVVIAQSEQHKALEVMKQSFEARGQAGLDRLDQDETQVVCSRRPVEGDVPLAVAERIQKANLATVKYPGDGKLMGDWREGEKIAQSGVGKQFSDDATKPSGGNCYACHQLSSQELAFGTIGPSLQGFGRTRGHSLDMQRYVYAKIYNAHAFRVCSNMPRFGAKGILTEQQITHLVALLLDPDSTVNK